MSGYQIPALRMERVYVSSESLRVRDWFDRLSAKKRVTVAGENCNFRSLSPTAMKRAIVAWGASKKGGERKLSRSMAIPMRGNRVDRLVELAFRRIKHGRRIA
ncbi:MAG TPA: hypothetical protein VHB45_13045 [Alloacidobacterium sp.]|nr:hypothetical protein [Alloacidobacterium sp.]